MWEKELKIGEHSFGFSLFCVESNLMNSSRENCIIFIRCFSILELNKILTISRVLEQWASCFSLSRSSSVVHFQPAEECKITFTQFECPADHFKLYSLSRIHVDQLEANSCISLCSTKAHDQHWPSKRVVNNKRQIEGERLKERESIMHANCNTMRLRFFICGQQNTLFAHFMCHIH